MAQDGDGWEEVPSNRRRRQRNSEKPHEIPNDPAPPRAKPIPPPSGERRGDPFLLFLVGLQGAGKSTFASYLSQSAPWRYVRINQDALGDRTACEDLTRRALAEGKVPVIDRCNVAPSQRRPFLDIATEVDVPSECVVFNVAVEDCVRRCARRKDHETLRPHEAREAVTKMAERFEPPLPPVQGRKSRKGESFCRVENVSSFQMANELADEYLARAL